MPNGTIKKRWLNEKGALTFEFLGILPFYFMFFLLLWQVVGSGYAVLSAKTAVNDAAKSYASTKDHSEAILTAQESIGNSSVVKYKNLSISNQANGKFTITLSVDHLLTFVPDKWKKETSLSLDMKATGKVLLQ